MWRGVWRTCWFGIGLLLVCGQGWAGAPSFANEKGAGRALIVLAAPLAGDRYYRPVRQDILDFQIGYARQILGRDNVVILADRATCRQLAKELPADILLEAPLRDIWTRDFLPAGSGKSVLFRYSAAAQAGRQKEADWVQDGFIRLAPKMGLSVQRARWILDGGNVVDNGRDKVIVTDRFLDDNRLGEAEAVALLREQLGVAHVAVLPADPEDTLGHADGMVAFVASNTVAVARANGADIEPIRVALRGAFPGIEIIEIDVVLDEDDFDPEYGSARGLYVNATLTDHYLYVPVFGQPSDAAVLACLRAASDREVVPVDAAKVSRLGGSVRCLGAQMKGDNARRLIEAARRPKGVGPKGKK